MIARIVAGLRRLWAWLCDPTGELRADDARYAADTLELDAHRSEPLLVVSSLDPREVGRQEIEGDAILDVVRWLECSGWYGEDRGALQCYAVWLLRRRAAYEQQGAAIS